MLNYPDFGFSKSVKAHNTRLDIFCDWIEMMLQFHQTEISTSDIVDTLIEDHLYEDQDFANEFVLNAWSELKRRINPLGTEKPYLISATKIVNKVDSWEKNLGHSFCVLISNFIWYKEWAKSVRSKFNDQGALFESFVKESIQTQFVGWEVFQTGWTKDHAKKIMDVVKEISSKTYEMPHPRMEEWVDSKKNEAGLDLICYKLFNDKRGAFPIYFFQCASGADWKDKLLTPNMALWNKIIDFSHIPKKAFAMPFCILDDDFKHSCINIEGLFFDRYRLLQASTVKKEWISNDLENEIITWMKPIVNYISELEN